MLLPSVDKNGPAPMFSLWRTPSSLDDLLIAESFCQQRRDTVNASGPSDRFVNRRLPRKSKSVDVFVDRTPLTVEPTDSPVVNLRSLTRERQSLRLDAIAGKEKRPAQDR
jgi:hypothetical protein